MRFFSLFKNDMAQRNINLLLDKENPDMYFQEQFRALRVKMEQVIGGKKYRVVVVTSAIAGEGKTITCANLAIALASAGGRKVLLLDADLRKPDVGRSLNMSPSPGMSEYLAGLVTPKQILRSSTIPGLYVITGGVKTEDPMTLLTGERLPVLMKEAREHFDIVLMDSPPVLPVADTLSLKNLVDGFVVVFRLGFTPYQLLGQAVEEIEEQNVIGIVLNGAEPNSNRYYQKYYGQYYRQGAKRAEVET